MKIYILISYQKIMFKLFHDLFDDPSIEVCLIFFQAMLPSLTNVDVAT